MPTHLLRAGLPWALQEPARRAALAKINPKEISRMDGLGGI
jgi:hypothetical protein